MSIVGTHYHHFGGFEHEHGACEPGHRHISGGPATVTPFTTIHVVFDGPPGPESGRFVEVETPEGRGLGVGDWKQREDGYWILELSVDSSTIRTAATGASPCP